jgi:2-polyprenyl-3-methyl-5-hydroxy-6-metoxy-1,4-benzoquinol methylase
LRSNRLVERVLALGRGTRSPAAVLIAFCFLSAAAISWARVRVVGTLALHGPRLELFHRIWPFLLFGCLTALAGHLYLRALRQQTQARPRRLLAGAIVIHLLAAPALPLTSSDVFSYLSYARLMHAGRNPYRSSPAELGDRDPRLGLVEPRWVHTPMVYGPVAGAATAAIAPVESVAGSLWAFKLEMLLAALAAVLLAYGFCRSCLPAGQREAAFVFFAWNPLFAWEISAQAHTEGLVLVGLLCFVWAATRGREWLALLGLAAAFYTKLVLAPLLCLYLCFVAWRRPLRAVAMAAAVAAFGAALLAPFWQGASTVRGPLATLVADPTLTARSLTDLLIWVLRPLGTEVGRGVYWAALGSGTLLLGFLGVRAALRARSLQQVFRDGLVFFLLYDLIAAPWFQSWYAIWLLPLGLVEPDARWRNLIALYSVLLLVQYGVPLDPLTYVAINAVALRMLWPLVRPAAASQPETAPTESVASAYDAIPVGFYDAVLRGGNPVRRLWHLAKFERVLDCLPRRDGGSILDIGCFAGSFLSLVPEDRFARQLGVDILRSQVEYARARYGTGFRDFRHLPDLRALETIHETFDCITGIELIEHLTPAELRSLMQQAAQKLVPGGRLVITTPNYASTWPLLEAMVNRFSEVTYAEQHITRFNYFQIERQLARLYPDFKRQFKVELKTTTHLLAPFLAGLSFRGARFLSRLISHRRWRQPFGNLVLLVAERIPEGAAPAMSLSPELTRSSASGS